MTACHPEHIVDLPNADPGSVPGIFFKRDKLNSRL